MDEIQILKESQLRQMISVFTDLQMINDKILFFPTLLRLDVALLENSANISKTSYKWIQLPLLRINYYMKILDDLFVNKPSLRENSSIQNALKDIEGSPRLLQMLLYYTVLFYYKDSIPDEFYNALLNIKDAYQILSIANSNIWFRIFKIMFQQFYKIQSPLKTVTQLLQGDIYLPVYSYAITNTSVFLKIVIRNITVNELVKKKLAFICEADNISTNEILLSEVNKVNRRLYLHLPFIYLHILSQCVITTEISCPILSLINKWSKEELTSEEAKCLSVNILLFYIYLLRLLKYKQVGLVKLIKSHSAISNANASLHKIHVNISLGNCIIHHVLE